MLLHAVRRSLRALPLYLAILLVLMLVLRAQDPAWAYLGKNASAASLAAKRAELGLDRPFAVQYLALLRDLVTLDLGTESWASPGRTVGECIRGAIGPSLSIALPALLLSTGLSTLLALVATRSRGRWPDRLLTVLAALGLSVPFVAWAVIGQYAGTVGLERATGLRLFAVQGWEPGPVGWLRHGLLPVGIATLVAVGFDLRFHRALLVAELGRPYVLAARAKGLSEERVLRGHVLRNAYLSILTRTMTTLPFVITGVLLLEVVFNVPGLGRTLHAAILARDFPVTQGVSAVVAAAYLASLVAADVLCAWVDPRVRPA